jgi:hypothetical protein
MPNLHRLRTRTWRAEDEEVEAALSNLPTGKNMGAYLRAAVRALGSNPQQAIAAVAEHWPPEPEITGRPRKQAAED